MVILWGTFENCSNLLPPNPPMQCSNMPHVQIQNITIYFNKEGIVTIDIPIPQDKGHTGI
jgi:hypothetical protein